MMRGRTAVSLSLHVLYDAVPIRADVLVAVVLMFASKSGGVGGWSPQADTNNAASRYRVGLTCFGVNTLRFCRMAPLRGRSESGIHRIAAVYVLGRTRATFGRLVATHRRIDASTRFLSGLGLALRYFVTPLRNLMQWERAQAPTFQSGRAKSHRTTS